MVRRVPTVTRRDAFQTGWKPIIYTKSVDNHRSALRNVYYARGQKEHKENREPRLVTTYAESNVASINSNFIKSKLQKYKTKFVPSPKV